MKLFKMSDMEAVKHCQMIFKFKMPNVLFKRRESKFMDSYKLSDNCLYKYISIFVSSYTPCPKKNGTNNVLGITLANTNM